MRFAIIQPYVPQYRVGFFSTLLELAREHGHEMEIFAGQSDHSRQNRRDAATPSFWTQLPTRRLRVGNKELSWKNLSVLKKHGPWDVVVCEQAVRNLETYALLLRRHSRYVAFWGHGRTYTEPISTAQKHLNGWLTNRADWFFAYTDGGAQHLITAGFPKDRITVLNNSIDTKQLRYELDSLDNSDVSSFVKKHGLTKKTALYVGGIDRPKKIDFLLRAAEHAHTLDPEFRMLFAGRGEEEHKVAEFCAHRPWAVYLGRVEKEAKALALKCSQILTIPGRLGLVIVDGFVAGLPTITTADPFHPPEYEYLQPAVNGIVSADNSEIFARNLIEVLGNSSALKRLHEGASRSAKPFSTEAMARAYIGGLTALMSASKH